MSSLYHEPRSYLRLTRIPFSGLHTSAARHAAAAAPRNGTVLDLGCGPGTVALRLAKARPDLRVSGVDPYSEMVEHARNRAEQTGFADRVTFHLGEAAKLPCDPESVDVIVSTMSFHHWYTLRRVITEWQRVLRPGASVYIYDNRSAGLSTLGDVVAQVAPEWTFRRKFLRIRVLPSLMFACATVTVPHQAAPGSR